MSTRESKVIETPGEKRAPVHISPGHSARIDAVTPAMVKATGMHRMDFTGAVHHLLDLGLKNYELLQRTQQIG